MRLTPGFRRLWWGNLAGNLADGLAFVVIPLLAAALTSDPLLIAGLSTAYSLTRLLVALPIGVLVDSTDRRRLLWVANLARGAALLVLAATVGFQHGSIAALYAAYCVVGILENAADGAASALVPDLVNDDQLDSANSQISTVQLIADEFVGPPLGGLLFGMAAAASVAVTGALYVTAGLVFRLLPYTPAVDPPRPRARQLSRGSCRQAGEGIRWAAGHRAIRLLLGEGVLTNFAYMAPFSILVVFALDTLHLDPTGYGVLLSVSSLGGLAGAGLAAPLRRRVGTRTTLVASMLLGSVTMVGLAFTSDTVMAAGLLVLYILHATVYGITATSLRQRLVPADLRGRVYAAGRVLALLGLSLGGFAGGMVARSVSVGAVFLLSSLIFFAAALWALRLEPDPNTR